MIGIVIQLIISWLILVVIEKKSLSALGFAPTKQRLHHFATGILLPVFYFTLLFFLLAYLGKNPYKQNESYSLSRLGNSIIYLLKAVAFENLIFTGALLYILIKRVGGKKAILISSISFGIYHWFSWNLFGQPATMALVFITTGIAGYIMAWAFEITRSIYLPFAIHFGIDFATMIVFSKDKGFGKQLLLPTYDKDPATPGNVISIIMMLLYFLGYPVLMYLYLKHLEKKKTALISASTSD